MESLWNKENIEMCACTPPKTHIENQMKYLSEETDGKIIGRVKEYDGEYIDKYEEITMSITSPIEHVVGKKVFDVQTKLGEQQRFVYEFYLTSKATPKYKYEIAFLDYSISFYPANMTLERNLAKELEIEERIKIVDEAEFIELLRKILNSNRVCTVIANLLKINS